jgi:hypothetical protein
MVAEHSYAAWSQLQDWGAASSLPGDDADNDGIVNAGEYALGGDPLDGSPPPSPTVKQEPERIGMEVSRLRPEVEYVVESSPDLIDPVWTERARNSGPPGTTYTEWIDTTDTSQLFLRFRAILP